MYRQVNIQQFYILSIQCVNAFCVEVRTNNRYSLIQHQLNIFITEI